MNKERFFEIVSKYLSNEADSKEVKMLNTLLKQPEFRQKYEDIAQKYDNALDTMQSSYFNIERGKRKLHRKIRKYQSGFAPSISTKPEINRRKRNWYNVAVSITVIILLSIGGLNIGNFFNSKSETDKMVTKKTNLGQKLIITLIEGTTITLNADSKLKYSSDYGNDSREIYLQGEAYFEVSHNPAKPFVVHSGPISTTVLGTKFNVKAFPKDDDIKVSLVEGKVKVSKKSTTGINRKIILSPNKQLNYNKTSNSEIVSSFKLLNVIGWKDNILKFDDEPFENILNCLERAYGIQFELKDTTLVNYKITANFKQASFRTILQVIKNLTNVNYDTITENNKIRKIIFYQKKC